MNDFLKASALILVSALLCIVLSSQNKPYSAAISMLVSSMVVIAAMAYFSPVLEFFHELKSLGKWNEEIFVILMKSAGIGIIMQIVSLLCSDSGNAALGKCVQILGTSVIMWISLPLFTELIKIVNELLGNI